MVTFKTCNKILLESSIRLNGVLISLLTNFKSTKSPNLNSKQLISSTKKNSMKFIFCMKTSKKIKKILTPSLIANNLQKRPMNYSKVSKNSKKLAILSEKIWKKSMKTLPNSKVTSSCTANNFSATNTKS